MNIRTVPVLYYRGKKIYNSIHFILKYVASGLLPFLSMFIWTSMFLNLFWKIPNIETTTHSAGRRRGRVAPAVATAQGIATSFRSASKWNIRNYSTYKTVVLIICLFRYNAHTCVIWMYGCQGQLQNLQVSPSNIDRHLQPDQDCSVLYTNTWQYITRRQYLMGFPEQCGSGLRRRSCHIRLKYISMYQYCLAYLYNMWTCCQGGYPRYLYIRTFDWSMV